MWRNAFIPWWFFALGGTLFVAFLFWTLAWKGMALWRAARLGHKGWFIALLLVNTAGILEILYIYVFSKDSKPSAEENKI